MRASRLVALLSLLQARGSVTAPELAADLEVSVRTIYRDVDALSSAGVPVYAEAGYGGGIRLLDNYRTRLTGLSTEEVQALLLGGVPSAVAQLGLGQALAAAQAKVLAELPPDLRAAATESLQRFHVDLPGWFAPPSSHPALSSVAAAVWTNRNLRFRYRREQDERERIAGPLGVVLKAARWYFVGNVDDQTRVYRVDRMRRVVITDEVFARPADFDLARFWSRWSAEFEASLPLVWVTVRVKRSAVERLRPLVDHRTSAAADWNGEPDRRGWRRLVLGFENLDLARASLLSLGPAVEVAEPQSLRDDMTRTARELSETYR